MFVWFYLQIHFKTLRLTIAFPRWLNKTTVCIIDRFCSFSGSCVIVVKYTIKRVGLCHQLFVSYLTNRTTISVIFTCTFLLFTRNVKRSSILMFMFRIIVIIWFYAAIALQSYPLTITDYVCKFIIFLALLIVKRLLHFFFGYLIAIKLLKSLINIV